MRLRVIRVSSLLDYVLNLLEIPEEHLEIEKVDNVLSLLRPSGLLWQLASFPSVDPLDPQCVQFIFLWSE